MKKILITFLVSLMVIANASSVFASSDAAQAELNEIKKELEPLISRSTITDCKNALVPVYDIEILKFLTFLKDNFENKSSDSSLANIGIARYSEYKKEIENLFKKLQPGAVDAISNVEEFQAYKDCTALTDAYIKMGKEAFVRHIKGTSYTKKTTVMSEKYKNLNSKLRELNFSIAEVYSFFATFKNKLPGFLLECIKS